MNPMDREPIPPGPPAQLQVGPLPTQTMVAQALTPDGTAFVTLQCLTPLGMQVYFLSPDHARQLAQHLHQFASAAASGLEIVGNLGDPPAPNGNGKPPTP